MVRPVWQHGIWNAVCLGSLIKSFLVLVNKVFPIFQFAGPIVFGGNFRTHKFTLFIACEICLIVESDLI